MTCRAGKQRIHMIPNIMTSWILTSAQCDKHEKYLDFITSWEARVWKKKNWGLPDTLSDLFRRLSSQDIRNKYGVVLVSKVSATTCFLTWYKYNPVKVKWPFLPGRIAKVCYPKTCVLYMDINIQKYLYSPMNQNKSSQGNVWNYLCATWNKAHVVIFSNQHLLKMFLSLCLTVTLL